MEIRARENEVVGFSVISRKIDYAEKGDRTNINIFPFICYNSCVFPFGAKFQYTFSFFFHFDILVFFTKTR